MSTPVFAILLACRFQDAEVSSPIPPALETLDDEPLVAIALRALRTALTSDVDITVVAAAGAASQTRSALAGDEVVRVIEAAGTIHASVRSALDLLPVDDDAWVLIHDACRPLTPVAQIDRVLRACAGQDRRPVIPVLPMTESVKVLAADGRIERGVVRESVVRVQTPQAARLADLRRVAAGGVGAASSDWTYLVPTDEGAQLVAGDELGMPIVNAADRELATVLRRAVAQPAARRGQTSL